MKIIDKGVCAAKGFKACGIHSGIRKDKTKKDLSLILSDKMCTAGAVYTKNLVKGAPLTVTKKHLSDGHAIAVICNSGNANTCNSDGIEKAEKTCEKLSELLKIDKNDIIVASTGVIGQKLNIEPMISSMPVLINKLSYDGSKNANLGIMTTDTVPKDSAVEFEMGGKVCHIGGIAKGSGMIHPDMATMLVFITSDVNISSNLLSLALSTDVDSSFNMLSVDGDTSTNDMVVIMANGMAENEEINDKNSKEFKIFMKALNTVTVDLCRKIAADGEGATKMIECSVINAKSPECAKTAAKAVVCSSLLKAAIFGSDANWGRVICALGYSGADIDTKKIDISFESSKGVIPVCKNGFGLDFDEDKAKEILLQNEITVNIDLNDGKYSSLAWGCDLTYEYVRINGDYRT